jgi:hypothetical protein
MFRIIATVLTLGLCSGAAAQVATFADVKAKSGVQLSTADLKQIIPGAKVISRTQAGSTRTWENKPDGTLNASTDGRGVSGGRNAYASSPGTWQVTDGGRFCVKIPWPRSPDDWCFYMFKVGDKYYGVSRLDDSANANEFEFSK